jgi:hypothetical protein
MKCNQESQGPAKRGLAEVLTDFFSLHRTGARRCLPSGPLNGNCATIFR